MRLVCPNCDAEYEVDSSAIPASGRDVQCSNCGHAWFQSHPEAEPESAAATSGPAPVPEPAEEWEPEYVAAPPPEAAPEPQAEPHAASHPEPEAAPGPEPEDVLAAEIAEVPPPAPVARSIDDSVLAVLREEAARETAARQAEARPPALETQTEMPLAPAAPPRAPRPVEPAAPLPEVEAAVRPRRDLFPAIEEINSTLRATSERGDDPDMQHAPAVTAERAGRAGFGRGFVALVLLGVILLALYVFAPLIGAAVPALAGAMTAYVAGVDSLRLGLDGTLRDLVGWLRGLQGNSAG
jgi:predicted Zn finger-like uncharacterized protein